jgi:hypothetical protein
MSWMSKSLKSENKFSLCKHFFLFKPNG